MKKTLLLLTIVLLSTASVFADDGGAIQGSNLTWEFITATGTLTISGNGMMPDFNTSGSNLPPWNPYKNFITNVIIGNGVLSIGNNAFQQCTTLPSVTIPSSVVWIGVSAFNNCSGLKSVFIADGSFVGDKLQFKDSNNNGNFENAPIDTLYLGRDLETGVANGSNSNPDPFRGNPALKIVTIGNKVTTINDYSFSECTNLQSLSLGSEITTIGGSAFNKCYALGKLIIPQKVTSIGNNAFQQCTTLPSVTIPSSVVWIGVSAFNNCSGLKSVFIADGSFVGDKLQFKDSNNNGNFENAPIDTLYLGRDLETGVANGSNSNPDPFRGNPALKIVTVGNKVTVINDYSFFNCTGLTQITSHPTIPPTINNCNAFSGVNKAIPVFINCDYLTDYKKANCWSDFTNYQCALPPVIITTTLPGGLVGTQYDVQLQATGTLPIKWLVESGNLPYGLTLSEEGKISGIPTTNDIFCFTVKATNDAGSDTKALCIYIEGVGILKNEISDITIFPNPTTGQLTIDNGELIINNVEIFDIYGRKQSSHHLIPSSSNHHINISHLSAGIYFLKIGNETVKVVKQ